MNCVSDTDPTRRKACPPSVAVAIAVAVAMVDGYDLFLFGAVGPSLLAYQPWGATAATLGLIGSLTTLGMPFGAIVGGRCADRFGRRTPLAISLTWVSVWMLASALVPSVELFAATRFATGLGLGALVPMLTAFVADSVPARRRSVSVGIALAGIAVGGLAAAFLARAVLPEMHFQHLFLLGVVPLALVPVVLRLLPPGRPSSATMTDEKKTVSAETTSFRTLFSPGFSRATVLFVAAGIVGLALVYGASTWLPTLMVNSGYDISSALEFTIAFNAGAIIGTLAMTLIADRGYLQSTTIVCFLLAAVAFLVLSAPQSRGIVLLASAVAGLGALGTQNLLNAFVVYFYPPNLRGTALGFTLGIGRVGAIAGPSYLAFAATTFDSPRAGFYAFVALALVGAVALALVPRPNNATPQTSSLKQAARATDTEASAK
ncbi:MFS transporter [Rhodococcus ruber]|uniref:MFS transporter n=1 Tax=Rhodococcus ruber TaxID=1830 RepID=A0ABT4ML84_9NOCA|nr:MFS transporter [Rhodococcus ruber]MCZ4521747.1 MFS transporter [Rhodococcus ruber]